MRLRCGDAGLENMCAGESAVVTIVVDSYSGLCKFITCVDLHTRFVEIRKENLEN